MMRFSRAVCRWFRAKCRKRFRLVHGSHLAFPDEHIEMVAEPPSRCARQLQEFTGAGTGVDSDLPLEVAPEVVVEDVMARHPPEPERQEGG